MSESEQERRGLARLLRRRRSRSASEAEAEPQDIARIVGEYSKVIAEALAKQTLLDEDVSSAQQARAQMRMLIDRFQGKVDGETRQRMAAIADEYITEHAADMLGGQPTDQPAEMAESREAPIP